MFKKTHIFAQPSAMLVATLLIALAMFTVHHDTTQASSWERCGGSATISGTVIDPDGNPLSGIVVEASVGADVDCPTTATGDAGTFTIEDLPADEWTLSFESRFDAQNPYGSPEPIVATVAASETLSLAEPIQMKPPAAFVQIVTEGAQNTEIISSELPHSGQLIFNPYDTTQNDNGGCGEIAFYGAGAVRAFFYQQETAYIANIAPGTYCMYAKLSDIIGSSTAQHFGTAYQAPEPRVVEIPAVPELIDLGAITFGQPIKRIKVRVLDEEGVGAAGVYVRATQDYNTEVDALTDQSGEALLALSHGLWGVVLRPAPDIDLGDTTVQGVNFAANNSPEIITVQAQGQRIRSAITGRLVQDDGTPLPDDTEWNRIRVTAWRVDESGNYATEPDEIGRFSITVPAGTYKIITTAGRLAEQGLFAPAPFSITVESEQVTAIGDVNLLPIQITATVQDEDGNRLANPYYRVIENGTPDRLGNTDCKNSYAFKEDSPPRTPVILDGGGDDNGLLQIGGLPAGEYCLIVRYGITSPLPSRYQGSVASVATVADEESTVDLGALVAETRNKVLTGRITQPDGLGIPNFPIRAQSMTDRGWANVVTATDGSFELALEQGAWTINIGESDPYGTVTLSDVKHLNRKWFVDSASQTVTFANDEVAETQQLDWELPEVSATISGTIHTPDGTPAIGLEDVIVTAYSSEREVMLYAHVDPTTGSYTLPVVGGGWQVRFQSATEYKRANDPTIYGQSSGTAWLTVANGETLEQDFTLVSLGATIRGQLLNPDGSPAAYGVVIVQGIANTSPNATQSRQIEVFNGTFDVNVEAGGVYDIKVGSPLIPEQSYNSMPEITVTAAAGEPVAAAIQLPTFNVEIAKLLHLPLMLQP